MHMNPVLQFAIDSQRRTRGLLVGVYGIPQGELDDCVQEVLLRILQANPLHADYPQQYWAKTVRSVAHDCWGRLGRQRRTVPLDGAAERDWPAGGAQDPAVIAEAREEIGAAIGSANDREQAALRRLLAQPPGGLERQRADDRVRIHRFRRRLQGATA